MYDVICVGSSTVDVFAKTKKSELIKIFDDEKETDLLAYPTGAKILVEELSITTGGGGTNVAVSLARLGMKVAYLGCMGKGANSDMVLSELKAEKVNTKLVVMKKGETGYSIILDSLEHDRTILAYKGLNNNLSYSDINKKLINTKNFYFSAMMEESFRTMEKLAEYAIKNKIRVAFNASQYLAEKGAEFLSKVLSATNILVLNKEEAELIAGKGDIAYLAKRLHSLGQEYVVITDGTKGAFCLHDGILYESGTSKKKALETTGAGDAFASTFFGILLMDNDIPMAMRLGTTNAESVISYHGAKNNLLSYKEAKSILKKRPIKVTQKRIS